MTHYKYHFFNDYSEGAHPAILQALVETNDQQSLGYGEDVYSQEATRLIREKIGNPEGDVYFVSSGTHANLTGISWLLKSYESIISVESGHICVHETGAIEATGHKVHVVPGVQGKLTPAAVQKILDQHNMDQMVKPRAIYLSQSTEVGTVYNKAELQALASLCKQHQLYLYIDGARLGHALTIDKTDLDLKDIADVADLFYIGGTKNGGLMGEAMVIVNPALKAHFRFHLRQKGALLAKARAVSVQFLRFFQDDLYVDLARHANAMAQKLANGLKSKDIPLLMDSPTNQVFPILSNTQIALLEKQYGFYIWSKIDADYSAIRLVTSWATPESAVDDFLNYLNNLA